jgi:hypothetical protein
MSLGSELTGIDRDEVKEAEPRSGRYTSAETVGAVVRAAAASSESSRCVSRGDIVTRAISGHATETMRHLYGPGWGAHDQRASLAW